VRDVRVHGSPREHRVFDHLILDFGFTQFASQIVHLGHIEPFVVRDDDNLGRLEFFTQGGYDFLLRI
jgi:hypothetical protein